jgi:hypothetical protein
MGRDGINYRSDLGLRKIRIFSPRGLDFDLMDVRFDLPGRVKSREVKA